MLELCQPKNKLFLCVVHRHPNISDDKNKFLLQSVVELCDKKLDNLVFVEDFNLPGIDWNNWCSSNNNQFEIDFLNILRSFYLLQHVSCPTRFRGSDTLHILDLVISNDSFIEEVKHLVPLGNSDQSVIYVKTSLQHSYRLIEGKLNYKKGLNILLTLIGIQNLSQVQMMRSQYGMYLKILL